MEGLISILIPCRNEERFIRACLESVLGFATPFGIELEIIVLDGRSSDRTAAIVQAISRADTRVSYAENPGIIQSCALNLGIRLARGEWIMRLDAHSRYPRDYLQLCYETALRTGAANVGGICITEPGDRSYQASLVQGMTTHIFGVGNSGFRVGGKEGPRDTVPFGFFRRDLFAQIGVFDERLARNQDYEFNRRICQHGLVVWLNPAIRSFYYNQPSLRAFFRKQFYLEAPYNVYTWVLAPYAFTPRHMVTGVFASAVLLLLAASVVSPYARYALAFVLMLHLLLGFVAAGQQAVRFKRLRHSIALPWCFLAYHLIHGLGLIRGAGLVLLRRAPIYHPPPATTVAP